MGVLAAEVAEYGPAPLLDPRHWIITLAVEYIGDQQHITSRIQCGAACVPQQSRFGGIASTWEHDGPRSGTLVVRQDLIASELKSLHRRAHAIILSPVELRAVRCHAAGPRPSSGL